MGERIAALASSINAAEAEMLSLIAEFDDLKGWERDGFGSCAEWLAWRTGLKPGSARERVRAARALKRLPMTRESMERGELSFAKVRAITRVATEDSEAALLELAYSGSAAMLERTVRTWKYLDEKKELGLERARHQWRRFSMFVDDDGMYVVRGRLTPEIGALLMRAVDAMSDELFHQEGPAESESEGAGAVQQETASNRKLGREPGEEPNEAGLAPTPEQRRADAVGLLAEQVLARGGQVDDRRREGQPGKNPPATHQPGKGQPHGDHTTHGRDARETMNPPAENQARAHTHPRPRAERFTVMVHVGQNVLESSVDDVRVSAETSRRLCCDASLVVMKYGKDAQPVSVGRKTRTIPPSLRRALEARDRRCRFPGCECRYTEAHHIKHWSKGGETSLRNLVLLCNRHHRAVHEGGVRVVRGRNGVVAFFLPSGRVMAEAPELQPIGARKGSDGGAEEEGSPGYLNRLLYPNRLLSKDWESDPSIPVWRSGAARYKRDGAIPWEIEAAAREAAEGD